LKNVKITDLKPGVVKGVEVLMPLEAAAYQETYFEWTASPLTVKFQKKEVSGGILQAWHHTPVFTEVETHCDQEMFYFMAGVALMLFVEVQDGQADLATAQVVRIQPGTQIIIAAGKAHFVPVAEGSEPVSAVVVSPKMDAPRIVLAETVAGVK
jgi:oxalate decarboxylase/phosphoglucose isomerase-like protein (cupin superfamily)